MSLVQNCQSSTAIGATARQVVSALTVPNETKEGAGNDCADRHCRARRRLCSSSASHVRRWPTVIGGLLGFGVGNVLAIVRFGNYRRFNLWCFHHGLNRHGLVAVRKDFGRHRRNVLNHQRTPLSPNDWIQFVHKWPMRLASQIVFAPMAICFQNAPSETARHGTAPVPPAVR